MDKPTLVPWHAEAYRNLTLAETLAVIESLPPRKPKPRAKPKYPGWRTMTAAQRYNARAERIWDEARRRGGV